MVHFDVNILTMKKLTLIFFLLSCAIAPIKNEIHFPEQGINQKNIGEGNSRLIIYNLAYHFNDSMLANSSILNVLINQKGLTQLKPMQYVVVDLPKGKHKVEVLRRDLFVLSSSEEIQLSKEVHYLEIIQEPLGNGIYLTHQLPDFFTKCFKDISNKKISSAKCVE